MEPSTSTDIANRISGTPRKNVVLLVVLLVISIFFMNTERVSVYELKPTTATRTRNHATTTAPTKAPTLAPTKAPTLAPTKAPTLAPTKAPTLAPTKPPTLAPTKPPTPAPTISPIPACGCPHGAYLSPEERTKREKMLQAWCKWLLSQPGFASGHLNSGANATAGRRAERITSRHNRTWLYYEDPRWPKPLQCNALGVLHVGERNPNTVCGPGEAVYMTSIPSKLDFYHPSKTGSSTIINYLKKLDRRASTDYCSSNGGAGKHTTAIQKQVFMSTRSPVERFVSGIGELLVRPCPKQIWNSAETMKICLDNHKLNISGGGMELAECIIREHECHPAYCESEHLFSQSFFVSRGGQQLDGPRIDMMFQKNNLSAQLSTFVGEALYGAEGKAPVSVPRVNVGAKKDQRIQRVLGMTDELLKRTEMLQILCRMYMQDFVCLDLELPEVCDKMLNEAMTWASLK
jgi:hypothetical protein